MAAASGRQVQKLVVRRQGYGTADVGCIAYECMALGGMHLAERCFVEICDPATGRPVPAGEMGEVVVTPFTLDYPLVRLATGDLSRLSEAPCACGRTLRRMERVGRRKLIMPTYKALVATEDGLAFAKAVFAKAKPGYHPITTGSVEATIADFVRTHTR